MADVMTVADVRKMLKGLRDDTEQPTEVAEVVSEDETKINLDAIPDDVDEVDLPDGGKLERTKPKGKGKQGGT